MLHGYCVRRAQEPPPDLEVTGVSAAAVRLLEHGRLGLWFSEAEPHPTVEALRQHEAVVRRAMRSSTPLPLRFGARIEDEAAVRALLESREAEFLAAFERIDQ